MDLDTRSVTADTPEIVPPYDDGELMWAAASYIFWPFLPAFMLLTARRDEPFLRFHFIQALLFGFLTTTAFSVFTIVLVLIYRSAGAPQGLWMGFVYVSLFGSWLMGLLFCFTWFVIFAWRAGRGDVFNILLIGGLVRHWML